MNDIFPVNIIDPVLLKKIVLKGLQELDSKTILALGGMGCLTTIVCVACVTFNGKEITFSKNGLSIFQPQHTK